MAITFNADTTNGLVMTPDTSGNINFQSAGSTITSITANGMAVDTNTLYVDATNNRVGIGTSSPARQFHLANTGTGTNTLLSLTSSTTDACQLLFGDTDSDTKGRFLYNNDGDYMRFDANGAERMRIDDNGGLMIGKTDQSLYTHGIRFSAGGSHFSRNDGIPLYLVKSNTTGQLLGLYYGTTGVGNISTNGTTTSYNTSSDYRLKENIVPMTGALEKIALLNPVNWTWKSNGSNGQGFIAHELQSVVPDCVSGEKDAVDENGNPEYQGVDTSFLVATLVKAIQEQQETITALETRIQALENV